MNSGARNDCRGCLTHELAQSWLCGATIVGELPQLVTGPCVHDDLRGARAIAAALNTFRALGVLVMRLSAVRPRISAASSEQPGEIITGVNLPSASLLICSVRRIVAAGRISAK